MSLGDRIKEVRKENKITQKNFAQELGISQAYVSKLEQDGENPSETLLLLISLRFAVSIEWLKTGEGDFQLLTGGDSDYEIAINRIRDFNHRLENQMSNYTSNYFWATTEAYVGFINILTDPYIAHAGSDGVPQEDPSIIFLEHINALTSYLWAIVRSSSETARNHKKTDYKALLKNNEVSQNMITEISIEIEKMVRDMLSTNNLE